MCVVHNAAPGRPVQAGGRKKGTTMTHPAHHRPRTRLRRGVSAAVIATLACGFVGIGAGSAVAAPIAGGDSIGDSLFAGIGNTGYDVLNYDVALTYLQDKSIAATTTITAKATQELSSFSLDFEGLTVRSVTVNGTAAQFSRTSNPAITSYKLAVTPAAPVSGTFTVAVSYDGVPTTHIDPDGSKEGWVPTADGATALGQPVGTMAWLPSNNTPADKATFDIAVTIPTTINGGAAAAVSNGELISRTPSADGAQTTWVWKQSKPMSTMVTLLSIGNYKIFESQITLPSGRVIPEWSFVDSSISGTTLATIQTRRAEIEPILAFLENKYGPYPGNSTGIVVDVTALGYALETQDRSYFERSVSRSTLVHELAHQWFGDSVSPADWNSIWISEGLASYAAIEYMNVVGGSATSTRSSYFNTWRNTAPTSARWSIAPGLMTDPGTLFDWHTYNRGAMTYEALRQSLTPEVFDRLLHTWQQRYAGTSQTSTQFIALAEEISGYDLTDFFQAWLFKGERPAWPSTWNLGLESTPGTASASPGAPLSYTLTATHTGQVPLEGARATVDLADILDDGTLDASQLPAELTLNGTSLTWAVPTLDGGASASVTFESTLNADAYGATLDAEVRAGTLGATYTSQAVSASTPNKDPVTAADLVDSARGGLTAPATATPGDTITVTLSDARYDGGSLSAVLFSNPRDLGTQTVVADQVQVTIPANARLGAHKIALVRPNGVLVGWAPLSLVPAQAPVTPTNPAAPEDPPATPTTTPADTTPKASDVATLPYTGGGMDTAMMIGAGALLLTALGTGALLIARRRRSHTGE